MTPQQICEDCVTLEKSLAMVHNSASFLALDHIEKSQNFNCNKLSIYFWTLRVAVVQLDIFFFNLVENLKNNP